MNWFTVLNHIPTHYLEDRANEILDALQIQSPDELNLRKLARHFGIDVHLRDENSCAQRFGKKYLVIVDSRLSLKERREQMAEEICHCLLPMGNQLFQPEWETKKQENLALRMAAYLLVPRRFILNLSIPEEETLAFELISDVFNVTPQLIRYRFELDYNHWLTYRRFNDGRLKMLPLKVAEDKAAYE